MEEFFKIGVVITSHGVKGEMKVFPTTDDTRRFKRLKQVYLEVKGTKTLRNVESARVSPDKVLLKLEGIDTPEEAVKLHNCGLFVDRANAVKLSKDEFFIADLMGMDVYDENGTHLGVLQEVLPTGANDVYQIQAEDGKEILLPAIHECILNIDVEKNKMTVHILPGLLDL